MVSTSHIFYSVFLFVLILGTILYLTRHHWLPHLPSIPLPQHVYQRLPTSFISDVESGLHSSNFDLASNITNSDDHRAGLNEEQKRRVVKIMKKKKVGFDEARRICMEERFRKEGIGSDGMPKDPKFVSFS